MSSDGTSIEARAFIEEVGYPIVVKPPAGLGSKGTYRIADAATLEEALTALDPSPERPLQAEEFVTGEENTLEAVTIGRTFSPALQVRAKIGNLIDLFCELRDAIEPFVTFSNDRTCFGRQVTPLRSGNPPSA